MKEVEVDRIIEQKDTSDYKTDFKFEFPDAVFWKKYEELWKNSVLHSPFQSTNLIKYLAHRAGSLLIVFAGYQGKKLIGVGMFKWHKGVLRLLTDNRSDQNSFVISKHLSAFETDAFFKVFFKKLKIRGWSLVLHKMPKCTPYMSSLVKMTAENGLFQLHCDYSVCPVLQADSSQDLIQVFNRSKNLRYKINRFIKQENIRFEVLEYKDQFVEWLNDFYGLHIKRWNNTSTTSKYIHRQSRIFQNQCMKAWLRDDVLVRFSIIKGNERIAMAMALRHKDGIIGNMQAFDPQYFKHSPGKTLLHFIAKWMHHNDLHILNFGDGNDPYKYEFANNEQMISTIFISKRSRLFFMLKAFLLKLYRENRTVNKFCKTRLKPVLQKFEMKFDK